MLNSKARVNSYLVSPKFEGNLISLGSSSLTKFSCVKNLSELANSLDILQRLDLCSCLLNLKNPHLSPLLSRWLRADFGVMSTELSIEVLNGWSIFVVLVSYNRTQNPTKLQ